MTLNKEISQLLDQSEDIATQTTYNGVHLLDQRRISSTTQWFDADAPFHANASPIVSLSVLASGDYTPTPTGGYAGSVSYDASGNPTNIYDPASLGPGTQYTSIPPNDTFVWDSTTNQATSVAVPVAGKVELTNGSVVDVSQIYTAVYSRQITTMPALGTEVVLTTNGNEYSPGTTGKLAIEPGSDKLCIARFSFGNNGISTSVIDFSELFSTTGGDVSKFNGIGFSLKCHDCPQYISFQFDTSTSSSRLYIGETSASDPKPMCYTIGIAGVKTQADLEDAFYNGIATAALSNTKYSGQHSIASLDRTKDSSISIADKHEIKLNYFSNTHKFSLTKSGPRMTLRNGITGELKTTDAYLPEQLLHIQSSARQR